MYIRDYDIPTLLRILPSADLRLGAGRSNEYWNPAVWRMRPRPMGPPLKLGGHVVTHNSQSLPGPRLPALLMLAAAAGLVAGAIGGAIAAVFVSDTPEQADAPAAVCPQANSSIAISGLVADVTPSVVSLHVVFKAADTQAAPVPLTGAATGFVFDTSGHIVTNQHVVADAETITVTLLGGESAQAMVIGVDEASDIAVLRVGGIEAPPLQIGTSDEIQVGDTVLAISNWRAPEGGPTASLGIVSATGRDILTAQGRSYADLIQTDAAMASGDSGGPLVDAGGRVVGVMVAGSIGGQCMGFAIPIDRAIGSINEILEADGE